MDVAALYDSLPPEAQNMPRAEFIKRVRELIDPRRMQQDLGQILAGRRQKRMIDRAVRR